MESPFPEQNHTLHLLEPLDSCQKSLWDRLFARTYAKPFILDSRPSRSTPISWRCARNWARRERLAHTLEKRFGLSFPRYVHKMKRSPKVTALHALT
jgi:hypothetical protein